MRLIFFFFLSLISYQSVADNFYRWQMNPRSYHGIDPFVVSSPAEGCAVFEGMRYDATHFFTIRDVRAVVNGDHVQCIGDGYDNGNNLRHRNREVAFGIRLGDSCPNPGEDRKSVV